MSSSSPGSLQVIGGSHHPITIRLQSGLVVSLDLFFFFFFFFCRSNLSELCKFTVCGRRPLSPPQLSFPATSHCDSFAL